MNTQIWRDVEVCDLNKDDVVFVDGQQKIVESVVEDNSKNHYEVAVRFKGDPETYLYGEGDTLEVTTVGQTCTVELTLRVAYGFEGKNQRPDVEGCKSLLEQLVEVALNRGLLTGDTDLVVDSYHYHTDEVVPL